MTNSNLQTLRARRSKVICDESDKVAEWIGAQIKFEENSEIESDLIKL